MHWFYLSLSCAVSVALVDALSKKALGRSDPYVVAWVRLGYCIPFLALSFLWISIPPLDQTFFSTVLILLPLEIAALLLYTHAIRQSPLSLTVPFLALTPVFLIGTSYVILGERIDGSGMAGILFIALGAYLLNIHTRKEGWLEPLRAILREGGSRKMIAVAFLYSLTSNLGKVAIQHSSPEFFGVVYFPLLALLSLPFLGMTAGGTSAYRALLTRKGIFVLIGFFQALMIFTHVSAISLIEVPYMISVKRTSLLFTILLGHFFFEEEHVQARILGAACMVAGVALILI
jgi:drug/metabolite transporter (DMT)-like permease